MTIPEKFRGPGFPEQYETGHPAKGEELEKTSQGLNRGASPDQKEINKAEADLLRSRHIIDSQQDDARHTIKESAGDRIVMNQEMIAGILNGDKNALDHIMDTGIPDMMKKSLIIKKTGLIEDAKKYAENNKN